MRILILPAAGRHPRKRTMGKMIMCGREEQRERAKGVLERNGERFLAKDGARST